MGDIVDLSPIKSLVRTIDFRVFVSLWCGVLESIVGSFADQPSA
jgi:hypothetical protein